MGTSRSDVALLTKSFVGEYEMCATLCRSIDRLMPDMPHYLIVERRDRKLFSTLMAPNRHIITTESLLPGYMRLPFDRRRFRWLTPYQLGLKSGWHIQQHAKLAGVAERTEQAIVVIDSDVEFFRPIDHDSIIREGKTRFLRRPSRNPEEFRFEWAKAGAKILNAPGGSLPDMNYVANVVPMDTRIVRLMLEHMGRVSGTSWKRTITRTRHVSEYTFYGQFIDYVSGPQKDMVFADERHMCHSLSDDPDGADSSVAETFINGLNNDHYAFGIQSNLGMSPSRREALSARLRAAGANAIDDVPPA